jgi:hypothetical protein
VLTIEPACPPPRSPATASPQTSYCQIAGGQKYRPPAADVNAPDLFVPLMAAWTYALLNCVLLALRGKFRPEAMSNMVGSRGPGARGWAGGRAGPRGRLPALLWRLRRREEAAGARLVVLRQEARLGSLLGGLPDGWGATFGHALLCPSSHLHFTSTPHTTRAADRCMGRAWPGACTGWRRGLSCGRCRCRACRGASCWLTRGTPSCRSASAWRRSSSEVGPRLGAGRGATAAAAEQ